MRARIGQNAPVALQKITAPDPLEMTGFVVTDLPDASRATGVVRCAKKVLQDGAKTMARSGTYAWAVLGEQLSGASAGISVAPADRDAGIEAFVAAVLPRVADGSLSLAAAKGVGAAELAALAAADTRSPLLDAPHGSTPLRDELLARGALAAAAASAGELSGRRIVLEGAGAATPALLAALAEAGAILVGFSTASRSLLDPAGLDLAALAASWEAHGDALDDDAGATADPAAVLAAEADVLLCGSKLGLVDDAVATTLGQRWIVPIGPVPVTAKGLAVSSRRDITVLADFVTTSGPLFADHPDPAATADDLLAAAVAAITATTQALADHPEGPFMAACYRAEEHLATWQEQLPFGRPLA